ACPDVRLLPRTTVFGVYDGGVHGAIERVADHLPASAAHQPRQRYWRIIARRTVLAAGAIERGLLFAGNDRPGIVMAGAARAYANRFAVSVGRRVAVCTNNDDGWRSAIDLAAHGIEVCAVIDTRTSVAAAPESSFNGRVILGARLVSAKGRGGVRAAVVQTARGRETIACDALAVSGGWNPNVALACHHD